MTKTELKNGNIVEWLDGEKAIVRNDLLLDITDLSTDAYISDYDINFNDLESKDEEWTIAKVYDNIIDMNLLWERKDTSSRIKSFGYEYKNFTLGEVVTYNGIFQHIVGFDERGLSIYNILITATITDEEAMEFKDVAFLSSSLDVAGTQLVKWVASSELNNIKENECIFEPTPKVKIPKYVKIVKCSWEHYWYNHRIGEVFEVKEIYEDGICYRVFDHLTGELGSLIDIKDCISIKKKELFKVGNFVKIKKSIEYDYCIPAEVVSKLKPSLLTISEVDENTGDVMLAEDENFYWWSTSMLKPVLD